MISRFFRLLLIISLPSLASGQVHVNCGGVNQVIPNFAKGDRQILSGQPIVEKNIIEPITSSISEFEIRFSYSFYAHQITIVVKCVNDSISVTSYNVYIVPKKALNKEELSLYTDAGAFKYNDDTTLRVFYAKATGLKSNSNLSWNKIFYSLIKNHFFDLPSQGTIDKIAKDHIRRAVKPLDAGARYYEIKIGNNYRFFTAGDDYIGVPAIAKYSQDKQNIVDLLVFQ